jgi:iron complex transport system substrate-binding protein
MRHILIFTLLIISFNSYAHRIVSTIPSVTEMLFFLGLGKQVVGVTPYCNYPKAAQKLPKVGSSIALNLETLVKIKPTVVILGDSTEYDQISANLGVMKIPVMKVKYNTIKDTIETFKLLNKTFDAKQDLKVRKWASFFARKKPKKKKKVLIVIDETISGDQVSALHVAGKNSFYHDLITSLGHENVMGHVKSNYHHLGLESLLKLKVDHIIRVGSLNKEDIEKKWKQTTYKEKVIYIFADYAVVPGPRLPQLSRDLQRAL